MTCWQAGSPSPIFTLAQASVTWSDGEHTDNEQQDPDIVGDKPAGDANDETDTKAEPTPERAFEPTKLMFVDVDDLVAKFDAGIKTHFHLHKTVQLSSPKPPHFFAHARA